MAHSRRDAFRANLKKKMQPINFFVFSSKTAFMPVRFIYPECAIMLKEHPNAKPLQCLVDSCPISTSCMETVAKRVHMLFDTAFDSKVELCVAYYSHPSSPGSIWGIEFWRDFQEPKVSLLNRSFFGRCKRDGIIMQWTPNTEYYLVPTSKQILPVASLVRGR